LIQDSAAALEAEVVEGEVVEAATVVGPVAGEARAVEGVAATPAGPGAARVVAVPAPAAEAPEGARSAQAKCTEILNTNNPA
jgi:hypothetical protein